jgi:polyhydroxybutyrate depolymerase
MRTHVSIAVAAACAVVFSAQTASAERSEVMTWKIDGNTRRAIVYAPLTTSSGGKAPLVMSFHGHGDNMENFQRTNLHEWWPEAIVVYFQGLPSRDGQPGWQVDREEHDRDLTLVDAALVSLREKFRVDDSRIYATGFSNGANFTYLLWAERPQVFAAFAPVAARLRPMTVLKEPRPVFHIAGRQDRQIPFADQEKTIEAARQVDRATDAGKPCGNGCTLYGAGGAAPVMAWIHPGAHEYPSGTSDRITQFFREHRKK